jgi:integrase
MSRRAREAFGELRALDLTVAVVKRQVRVWQTAKVRPATINRRLATLFRGLELAVEDKLLPRMPDCRIAMLEEDCPFVFHRSGANLGDFGKTWAAAWTAAKPPLYPAPAAADPTRLGPRTFHDLRRTAARNLIRAGVDRKTAKLIPGHRTDSIFDRYDIKRSEDVADALTRVGQYVATLSTEPLENGDGTPVPLTG